MNIGEAISKLRYICWHCPSSYDMAMQMAIDALRDKQKVERYDEIMQAEREGRFWIVPFKVGDTVWIKNHRFPAEIQNICLDKNGFCYEYAEYERSPEVTELWDDGYFVVEDIGKTVFLTREAAEKALEEEKCD